ncbi:MAG: HAD-IC family P-type ATPase [Clostridiaceae bacterium]|nr:HAD-IC family P-type ATPase [Clostridiaceae bacterium]
MVTGLSSAEAAHRAAAGQDNRTHARYTKPVWAILRENLCTVFNLINFLLAAAVLAVGSYKNALFLGVVITNLAIGIVQEIRAKAAAERLELAADTPVTVLRDGGETAISREAVVLDDVYRLRAGDRVPTDGVILDGACEADTAALTGESLPAAFSAAAAVSAGFILTSGTILVRATAVGDGCRMARIAESAKTHKPARSEIMRTLNRVVTALAIAILPLGALLLWRQLQISPWDEAIVSVTAALINMIPEGLVLLTSTVLAVAVIRLSKHRVLVRELASIESLARVDMLCLDKTGTLTEGDMEVAGTIPLDGSDSASIFSRLAAVLDDASPTFNALHRAFPPDMTARATAILPFSSTRKYTGAAFGDVTYLLGAPEWVMPSLPDAVREAMTAIDLSLRVLLLVRTDMLPTEGGACEKAVPVALVTLRDRVRETAPQTMAYFTEQGVALRVLSGDNPATASAVAARAGVPDAWLAVDAATLKTSRDIADAVSKYVVFGRVTPLQKKEIIEAMQQKGHTVAMTGDGVNDVPALRAADCGVAMATGTDAARAVAKLVLLNSDFSAMPAIVAEGRRSVNNLQRSASLFLIKTLYATALAVLFAVVPWEYPFVPIQATLVSVTTIGIPSFLLALEPGHDRIRGRFLANILKRALPGALAVLFTLVSTELAGRYLGLSSIQIGTACVGILGVAGLVMVRKACTPPTPIRILVFCAMAAGFMTGYFAFPAFFELAPISSRSLLYIISVLLTVALFEAIEWLIRRYKAKIDKGVIT